MKYKKSYTKTFKILLSLVKITIFVFLALYFYLAFFENTDFFITHEIFYRQIESQSGLAMLAASCFLFIIYKKTKTFNKRIINLAVSFLITILILKVQNFNQTIVDSIDSLPIYSLIQLLVISFLILPTISLLILLVKRKVKVYAFCINLVQIYFPLILFLTVSMSLISTLNSSIIMPNLKPLKLIDRKDSQFILSNETRIGAGGSSFWSCYFADYPFLSSVFSTVGDFLPLNSLRDLYLYQGSRCSVVILGNQKLHINDQISINDLDALQNRDILAEILIDKDYGKYIRNPRVVSSNIDYKATPSSSNHAGTFDPVTNKIEIDTQGNDAFFGQIPLSVIIHEELHAKSPQIKPIAGVARSGMDEAITAYLTSTLIKRHFGIIGLPDPYYINQEKAILKLTKYVGMEKLLDTYFNGSLFDLTQEVDSKTYPGAYCSFNYYIDSATVVNLDQLDFSKGKALATQAEDSLSNPNMKVSTYCSR